LIVAIFLIGFFGYLALSISFIRSFVIEASGFLNLHYKQKPKIFHWGLFIFFLIVGILSFYIFFGKDAIGPILGGLFVLIVSQILKWLQDGKEKQSNNHS
jgi:nicotinamide riboside transporter PnuC